MSPRLHVGASGLGRLVFDDEGRAHNIFDEPALGRLDEALAAAEAEAGRGVLRGLVVWSAKPDSFVAGADVAAIAGVKDAEAARDASRRGQELFARLAALPVPAVSAIRGVCLGGGAELALACSHRVAADDEATRIGFPEVSLGILPAWGGMTRLPELVGLRAALELVLSGKPVGARKARRIGLVDLALPASQFEERAMDFARDLVAEGAREHGSGGAGRGRRASRKLRRRRGLAPRLLDGTPPGRALVLRMARRQVAKRAGGRYPAPLKILDVARRGVGRSRRRRFELETEAVGELAVSAACKNLLFLFQLRERARKGPWAEGGGAKHVDRAAVIGAGVMGGAIAQALAYRDLPVRLKDVAHEAVTVGLASARSVFDAAVGRRRLSHRDAERKMGLVEGGLDYIGVARADLVVEAVVERMDVKQTVCREVEEVVREDAVLATNTSSLSVDQIAAALERPERFAGMHFFNPVHRMPLVEVVRGRRTSADAVETIAALAVRLGKTPVVTRDGPGFLVNRILAPCLNEAGHLLDEGWDAAAVDAAWTAFGVPTGPFRLMDEVGLDVVRHAGDAMAKALGDRLAPAPALAALGRTSRMGRKGGGGFYKYRKGKRPVFDVSVYEDLRLPRERRAPVAEAVQERLVLAMINEAARVLDDGIVAAAADVDLGMVMGTGFPPFRGGLLKHADDRGTAGVLAATAALHARLGDRWTPSRALRRLGEKGERFHAVFPGR